MKMRIKTSSQFPDERAPFPAKGFLPTIITLNVLPFVSRYNLSNSDALKFSRHL